MAHERNRCSVPGVCSLWELDSISSCCLILFRLHSKPQVDALGWANLESINQRIFHHLFFSPFFLDLFHYFLVFLIQSTAIKGPLASSVIRFLLSSREKLFFSDSRMWVYALLPQRIFELYQNWKTWYNRNVNYLYISTLHRLFFCFHAPAFITDSNASIDDISVTDPRLCWANRTDQLGKNQCKEETKGGNTLYYALFVLGMVVAGAGCTPMYTLGIPYMDENVKAKVTPMYVGIFAASGILGKLPW